MKKLILFTTIFVICHGLFAQKSAINTQKIGTLKNLKDAWDISYNYTGEIINGKPDGYGVATYSNGTVTRYVGQFVNGFYSGKGVMLFVNGSFSAGNWLNGKLDGKGGYTTEGGVFYAGELSNGMRNGAGILVYKDNSFVKGNYKNDKLTGRCVNVWTDGNIISDIYYNNDLRNGTGFQYEVGSDKLYEGEWKDDKWVQASSAGFTSFLNETGFKGEKTSDHILIGSVTRSGYLRDTAYFYDLNKHKRYFGYYIDGFIKDGLQLRDDSTRFVGAVDDNGAKGYCYDFKFGKYYTQGTFMNDLTNGEIIDIDLVKKTVYIGFASNGTFTGKAHFFNDKGSMYYGDYINGRLNGQGFRLESSGHYTEATWKDGSPVTVTKIVTAKGDVISGTAKSFNESLNIVVKDFPDYFDNIISYLSDDYSYDDWLKNGDDDTAYYDYYNSLIRFFGSTKPDVIADDLDVTDAYIATMYEGDDASKAKAKYNEVVKQLSAATITNSKLTKPTKLKGEIVAPDLSKKNNTTEFDLDADASDYASFHIWVKLLKGEDGNYIVLLEIGEMSED